MSRLVFNGIDQARDYLKELKRRWKIKNRVRLTEDQELKLLDQIKQTQDYLRPFKYRWY